jgi:hypothetical protein
MKRSTMKNIILILALFLSSLTGVFAQEVDPKKAEKIESLKIAFITQKLNITPEEAQKFWPVYTRYENEMRDVIKEHPGMDVLDNEEKVLNIRKKYRNEFSNLLGQPRVNNLFKTENEFRGILMRHLRNHRPNGEPQRPLNRPMLPRR